MSDDLIKAIKAGDANLVQSLLESNSDPAWCANAPLRSVGPTTIPLVLAARRGHVAVVDVLLRGGACVDNVDDSGQTACHAAVVGGHVSVVATLIAHGATLLPALELALGDDDEERQLPNLAIVTMLIKAGAPIDNGRLLCRAAAMSCDVIRALLDRGVVVAELLTEHSRNLLHVAATLRVAEPAGVLDMLVNECNIGLEAIDSYGSTCTHLAALYGRGPQLRWFIEAGVDLERREFDSDRTPLLEACWALIVGGAQTIALLLAAGADASVRDRRGRSACQLVAEPYRGIPDAIALEALYVLLAGGSIDAPPGGITAREMLAVRGLVVDDERVEPARRIIGKVRLDFVRERALQVCIGLQSRGLDALQLCEILVHACGPVATMIEFHQWWQMATIVKHSKQVQLREQR